MQSTLQSSLAGRSVFLKPLLCAVTAVMTLGACAEPELTRRWKTLLTATPPDTAVPTVSISAFTLDPQNSSSGKTVFNLSGEGQAAFINALSPTGKLSAGALRKALSQKISGASAPSTDFTTYRRRLVLDIERTPGTDADRLIRTTTTITFVDPAEAEFKDYDKFATRYETVDLGSLTFKQTSKIEGEAKIEPASPRVAAINITGSYDEALTENVVLKRRIAAINPHFSPDEIRIDQEGEVGRDLVGNQAIDLTVRLKKTVTRWRTRLDGFDGSKPVDTAQVAMEALTIPASACNDIKAMASLKAKVRVTIEGQDTFTESDDKVVEPSVSPPTPTKFTLVPKKSLRQTTWGLRDPANPGLSVRILADNGIFTPLAVTSYTRAKAVLNWLRQHKSATLGKRTLQIGGVQKAANASGYNANINRLAVWINRLNWAGCP